MRWYCTYFDHHYLARGVALLESLRQRSPDFHLWVLCLSPECHTALQQLALPGVEPIALDEFEREDVALQQAKANRSLIEYYFTCTPSLLGFILARYPGVDCLTYLDSDLYFFGDPELIFQEIGAASVAITPHRFPAALKWKEQFGLFNVGWLTFRRDPTGLACLERWRNQCLEWCYDRCEDGHFADQKYLDEWPSRYPNLKILRHPGINAAPWNVAGCRWEAAGDRVLLDGQPLLLFHFHQLKRLTPHIYDPSWAAYGVRPDALLRWSVYAPYLAHLEACRQRTEWFIPTAAGTDVRSSGGSRRVSTLRHAWRTFRLRRMWHANLAWFGVLRRRHFLIRNGRVWF